MENNDICFEAFREAFAKTIKTDVFNELDLALTDYLTSETPFNNLNEAIRMETNKKLKSNNY